MKILLLVKKGTKKVQKQVQDLKRLYGEDAYISKANISETAKWTDVVAAGADCDVLAGDFSREILINLIDSEKNKKPVILTVMQRIYGGFNYIGLQQVKMAFEDL